MKKRVIYLLMTLSFIITTICQAAAPVLAVATTDSSTKHLSKVVNYSRAFANTSSVSESLASSLQSQSTSSASTSSDSKSSSTGTDSKVSSSSASKKESTKTPVTSKSVLIQRAAWRPSDITDPGSEYPDFSMPLSGQNDVTTIKDVTNPVDDNGDQIEIPYPYNAFPTYIPGVSSEEDHLSALGQYGTFDGANLEYDENGLIKNNYIDYKKVMMYTDAAGKVHWIDMKQRFIGFEKHGWSNDAPEYLKHNYTTTSTGKFNLQNIVKSWRVTDIGKGTDKTGSGAGLLGVSGTFIMDTFLPQYIPTSASTDMSAMRLPASSGGGYQSSSDDPGPMSSSNRLTVRAEFYDNETGKPIKISGFLTMADLDHRDYIEFTGSSNINHIYVTQNPNELRGTSVDGATGDDVAVRVVNHLGNLEYDGTEDSNGKIDTSKTSYAGYNVYKNDSHSWSIGNTRATDIITPFNTDAWATVTFDQTDAIQYSISDEQQFNFLPTALVPVAFSAPGKAGDEDVYNARWDDKETVGGKEYDPIDYRVSAVLPYRGGTIKDPQDNSLTGSKTTSTFKPAQEFKLVDDVDQNLLVSASDIKITSQTGDDVTSQFTIDVTNNKVTAAAKPDFLGVGVTGDTTAVEKNYAKTYTMDIHTRVKKDPVTGKNVDLGDYQTVSANGKSYAVIPNKATLYDIKKVGAPEDHYDSNVANGHVKVPDPVREVQDMKQEIKNFNTAGEDWQPVVDDTSTTSGYVGDKIGYRFSFKAKTTNTASISDASINKIQMAPGGGLSAPENVKVTVGTTTTDGTLVEDSTGVYSIKVETPIKAGQSVTVAFDRTATKKGVYTQLGFLKADSLTTQPSTSVTEDGNLFNPADLTIKEQNNTATIQQFIKNRDTANETWQGPGIGGGIAETSGVPGNIIDYKFVIQPGAKNTAALMATALKDIAMKESGGMTLVNPEGSMDNTKQVKVTIGSAVTYISGNPISNSAALNDIVDPLPQGTGMTIEYSAKISKTAYTQDVTNDANFYASNLTGNMPAASTVDDKAHKTPANQSILHIKNQREVEDLKQKIKNKTAKEDWHYDATKDPKAETDGHVGDVIAYEFSFTALTDNTADIEGQIVKAIGIQKNDQLTAPANMAVTVGDNNTPITATLEGTTENDYSVKLADGKGITAGQTVKVYLERTVKPAAAVGDTYIQSGQTGDGLSAGAGTAFNDAVLHITMPLQTPTIKQTINNTTSGVASTNDGKTAVGKAGDIIDYQFYVNAPATADKNLINAALKDIQMQMDATTDMTLVPYDATATTPGTTGQEVKVYMNHMSGKPVWASVADFKNGTVKIPTNPDMTSPVWIQVNYRMKIGTSATDGETITNDGNLYADNLQGTDHKMAFNPTVLNIKNKHAATSLKQTIHNITRPALDDKTETDPAKTATKSTGKLGDTIEYKFSAKATDTNTSDLMNVALDHIKMATTLSPADPNYMTLVKDPTISISINNGGTITAGTEADFNAGKFAIGNVAAKATISVTYRMKVGTDKAQTITNSGWLTADNLEGTTVMPNVTPEQKGIQFNDTILTIVPQVNHATIEQFIRNPRTNPKDQAWFGPGYGDGKAETTAVPGDEITYLFKIQLPTDANNKYTNDAALLNTALKDIAMNKPDDMTLIDLDANGTKVQIDYATSPTEHRVNVNSLADLKDIALLSPLDTTNKTMMSSTGVVKVQYRAKVNANAQAQDVTNDANFYASNLTGDLKDQTVANYQQKTKANQSIVHIQGKKEVTIKQQIKNVFNPSENVSDPDDPKHQDAEGYSIETSGTKNDVIAYRFTVKAAKDNTGDITGLKVNNIKLDQPTKLTHTDDSSNQPYTLTVAIKNADGTSAGTDTGATFSAAYDTITLTKPLKPGQTVTITYMMKITAEIDEAPNGNNVIHNNGKLTADELTKSVTVGTVTNNEALKPDAEGGKMTFNATILNLEKGVGKITIRYVDLDEDLAHPDVNVPTTATDPAGSKIADSVTATGKIGDPISSVVSGQLAPKEIEDYTVLAVTEDTDLSINHGWEAAYKDDPAFEKDDRVITYGYKKRMIGIAAPKYWDFGNYNRDQKDQTYYLDPNGKPQKVTVTDNYGVKSWDLNVKQESQFKDDRQQELKDAQLRFKNGTVTKNAVSKNDVDSSNHGTLISIPAFNLTPGPASTTKLMTFTKTGRYQGADSNINKRYDNPGVGVWNYNFGNKKTAGSSIGLHVPATTKRDNTTYQAVLEWSLAVGP